MATNADVGRSGLSAEFWAIIRVGVALAAIGGTAITLEWNMYARLDVRMERIEGDLGEVKERCRISRAGFRGDLEKGRRMSELLMR